MHGGEHGLRVDGRPLCAVRMMIGGWTSPVQLDVSPYLRARGHGAVHGTNRGTSVEHVRILLDRRDSQLALVACHTWCSLHPAAQLAQLRFDRYLQMDLQWIG